MGEMIILGLIILVALYNILYLLPHRLKEIEDKMLLQFKEINIRLNKLEDKINKLDKEK